MLHKYSAQGNGSDFQGIEFSAVCLICAPSDLGGLPTFASPVLNGQLAQTAVVRKTASVSR
jgi:hypothetical protein